MKIEHLAFNVTHPLEAARWYVSHLGMRVARKQDQPPYGHFLVDSAGAVMVEFYCNPKAVVPDYFAVEPLNLHLAFISSDIEADLARLRAAGAAAEGEMEVTPLGDRVAMLRDPWGLPIQLVQRKKSML